MKIPLTILTGYLGAGKTTLLRNILEKPGMKIAILMNEFGEIGIDQKIIKGKDVDIAELSGGCVCCSLTGEFEFAVKEILQKTRPDWIIVETTGTAEPDAIVGNMESISGTRLDSVITLVDADSIVRFPSLGHIGRVQIEVGDLLILNKTDLVSESQLKKVRSFLKKLNPKAPVIESVNSAVPVEMLFGIRRSARTLPGSVKKVSDKGITHFTFTSRKLLDRDKFQNLMESLPSGIYRAKGFVNFNDGTYLFNFVAGRLDMEKWKNANRTEMVFIGEKAKRHEKSIIRSLNSSQHY